MGTSILEGEISGISEYRKKKLWVIVSGAIFFLRASPIPAAGWLVATAVRLPDSSIKHSAAIMDWTVVGSRWA